MTWVSFKQCCTSGSYLPVDQRRFHSPINARQVQFLFLAHNSGIGFQSKNNQVKQEL